MHTQKYLFKIISKGSTNYRPACLIPNLNILLPLWYLSQVEAHALHNSLLPWLQFAILLAHLIKSSVSQCDNDIIDSNLRPKPFREPFNLSKLKVFAPIHIFLKVLVCRLFKTVVHRKELLSIRFDSPRIVAIEHHVKRDSKIVKEEEWEYDPGYVLLHSAE